MEAMLEDKNIYHIAHEHLRYEFDFDLMATVTPRKLSKYEQKSGFRDLSVKPTNFTIDVTSLKQLYMPHEHKLFKNGKIFMSQQNVKKIRFFTEIPNLKTFDSGANKAPVSIYIELKSNVLSFEPIWRKLCDKILNISGQDLRR